MTVILVDFSQMVISSVAANQKDFVGSDASDLIKHIALNQLLALKKRFNGRIILCCDGRNYWRKTEFLWYKGHRKHSKDKGNLDWDIVYETLNGLIEELSDNFPYVVLQVDGAEADDIIGVLTKYLDTSELQNTGLIEEPQEIIIGSTDKDFQQLQKYRNVKQWNNVMKKFVVCKNPKQFLIEHIVTGDTGDNIPSITNSDIWAQQRAENVSTRAKPFATSRLKEFYNKGIDACKNEEEQRNYRRNERLVDLDLIPIDICVKIIEQYINYEVRGNKSKVFSYLNKHRMKLLLSSSQDF